MDFIESSAIDIDGEDNDAEEANETDDLRDFIYDTSFSFVQEKRFYRSVDASLDNQKYVESDDESDWFIDMDAQVENYTPYGLIKSEYDEFKGEKDRLDKFLKICITFKKTDQKTLSFKQ